MKYCFKPRSEEAIDTIQTFKNDLYDDFLARLEILGHHDIAEGIRDGRYAVKDFD